MAFLEVIIIQVLAKTDYQDVYRVIDGVLLIVNKFEYMFEQRSPVDYSGKRRKMYHKNTKDLAINQEDKIDWHKNFIPKGTVLYHNYPVVATDNQPDWTYEIKTTGDALSGSYIEVENLLSEILYTIRTGERRQ